MRTFGTGATRDSEDGKIDPEGSISPLVIARYSEYMRKHCRQSDGSFRSCDNWQKGMPVEAYMKSMWRHMLDVWLHHRGFATLSRSSIADALCGVLFNASGYLHETEKHQPAPDHSWADAAVKQDHEPLYYLATPYTKYEGGIEAAFEAAAAITARLVKANLSVYSPIAHAHPVAVHGGIDPLDHSIWLDFDLRMMRAADCLIVAQMQGWRESFGVSQEIKFFQNAGKPILYLNCTTFTFANEPHGEAGE